MGAIWGDRLICLIWVIISQYIHISKHHGVQTIHLKIYDFYVSITSQNKIPTKQEVLYFNTETNF